MTETKIRCPIGRCPNDDQGVIENTTEALEKHIKTWHSEYEVYETLRKIVR